MSRLDEITIRICDRDISTLREVGSIIEGALAKHRDELSLAWRAGCSTGHAMKAQGMFLASALALDPYATEKP